MTSKLLFLWLLSCTYVLYWSLIMIAVCSSRVKFPITVGKNTTVIWKMLLPKDYKNSVMTQFSSSLGHMQLFYKVCLYDTMGFHHNNFIFKPFLNLYTANFKEYGRFLILHEYIIPQFNRFASNRENLKLQTPNFYI